MDTTELEERAANAESQIEFLQESLVDMQLAMDSRGWSKFGDSDTEFSHADLVKSARIARVMSIANPLIRRGLSLRTAYVWGQGVQISAAAAGDEGSQDVNAVIQEFLDDEGTRSVLSGSEAQAMNEHTLGTDGTIFFALFTSPLTGRVQPRTIPLDEVCDVITNPEDRSEVWFFKRRWAQSGFSASSSGGVSTNSKTQTMYYPALGFAPSGATGGRVKSIDGDPVDWSTPVLRVAVNRLDGWKYGIGDAYAAIFWARAYKEFLEDWARLVKALSRFAWQAQAKKGSGRAQARNAMMAAPVSPVTGQAGATAITSDDVTLTAIPKTGATIDSESGRPLAAMVAAAFDIPVTMLLGDPGVTGSRATAETLDQPMELGISMRRGVWSETFRRILGYVIDQAVKAPQGALKGTRTVNPHSGREAITLTDEQDRSIDVNWPPLGETPVGVLVTAITTADATGKLPEETVARLLMSALGVDNADELIATMTDAAGVFVPAGRKAALDSATQAAQGALEAVRRGDYPTDKGGG